MVLYHVKMSVQPVHLFPRVDKSELVQLVCIVTNSSDQCAIHVCRDSLAEAKHARDGRFPEANPYRSSQEFSQSCT